MYNYACNTAHVRCPIPGQVFKECVDCPHNPATCKGHILGNACTLQCLSGCECPTGQVLDVKNKRCVFLKQCLPIPGHADLPPVPCQLIRIYILLQCNMHACLILTHAVCPIPSQVYKEQVRCPQNPFTCKSPFHGCVKLKQSGCEYPTGKVLDEENNTCVFLKQCPLPCQWIYSFY